MNRTNYIRILFLVLTILINTPLYAEQKGKTVWVDVRSVVEHRIDNIEGDVRISHKNIVREVNKLFPDKDTEIRLYCRSGGRAGKAQSALIQAGYSNVLNIGSINHARLERSLTNSKYSESHDRHNQHQ